MGDFGADVAAVRSAEALLVMVPAKGVLDGATEARDMQAILMLLVLYAAYPNKQLSCQFAQVLISTKKCLLGFWKILILIRHDFKTLWFIVAAARSKW